MVRRILVVGGNGFVGSAVCRAALARGIQVTSVSSSGNPYRTAKGHSPAWTANVDWQKGDALNPESFSHLFPEVDGVVHTLGMLLENTKYKQAVKEGNVPALAGVLLQRLMGDGGNPLERGQVANDASTYEAVNRDAALRTCESFMNSERSTSTTGTRRPFIYISAEDIFRPAIPARYIETKREAEAGIEEMTDGNDRYRGVYIRPSVIYHAHERPLSSPIAALVDLSATVHRQIGEKAPTPSSVLRYLGGGEKSVFESMANCLVIPPIHVDHVAGAVCAALERNGVNGVVGVGRMRELIGWS